MLASAALMALAPATAVAHSHHAKRSHRTRHARVRTHIRHLRAASTSSTPTTSSSDNAGTVQSFDGTTLVVLLNDGVTTVAGAVTADTNITCESAPSTSVGSDMSADGSGDQGTQSGDQSSTSGDQGDQSTTGGDQGDQNDQGDDNQSSCDTSNLTPGTVVHSADLKVSSAGSTWDNVDLVVASASTPSSSSGD